MENIKANIQVKVVKDKVVIYNGVNGITTELDRSSGQGIILESFVNNLGRYFPESALDFAVKIKTPWKKMTEKEYKALIKRFK